MESCGVAERRRAEKQQLREETRMLRNGGKGRKDSLRAAELKSGGE